MKNKIFILIFVLLFIFTTSVFAVDSQVNSDIYKATEEIYSLDTNVSGNIFAASDYFEMLDTSSVLGNLYVMADTVHLKSNVTYSNAHSNDGSPAIEFINSHSVVHGNAFIICKEFILEPGAEINGDLYIIAEKIDIQNSSSIYGNFFAISNEIVLNGRVKQSVYATTTNFNMNYYGSIARDLNLTSENVSLSSVIRRNAYISSNSITTNPEFLLYGNLEANSHKFDFSGQVDGNAIINSKELNFIKGEDINCLISGNLNYSCNNEIEIGESIVLGEITSSPYVEKINTKPTFSFKDFTLALITFVVYVFVIALIFKLLNKNYQNLKHEISIKNTIASFGIGLLSILAILIIAFVLLLIPFGITLSFTLVFAYIFLLFIAIPVFVLDIALLLKDKFNLYLSIALIPLGLYLISSIPVIGGFVMFVVLMTGVGRICNKILFKKV